MGSGPAFEIGDWAIWQKHDPPALVRVTRCLPDDTRGRSMYGVHRDRMEIAEDDAVAADQLRPLAPDETVELVRMDERLGKR
jgi:hypothetical protein